MDMEMVVDLDMILVLLLILLHKTPKTQFHLGHCQLIYLNIQDGIA
jgi:hypothetical protein